MLAQVLAVGRVVTAFVLGIVEIHRFIGLALVRELCCQHTPGLDRFAAVIEHFVNDAEAVAFAQVAVKVDVGGKYLGDLGGDGVGQAGGVGRAEQGIPDFGRFHEHAALELDELLFDQEGIGRAIDRHQVACVQIAQAHQFAVRISGRAHGPAGNQLIQCLRLLVVAQNLGRFGVVDLQPRQQRSDGVTALDAFLAREGHILGRGRRQSRQPQFLDDVVDGQFINHRIRRDPKRGNHAEAGNRDQSRREPVSERNIAYLGRNFSG